MQPKTRGGELFHQKNSKLSLGWLSKVPLREVGISQLGSGYAEGVFYEMLAYLTSARALLDALMPILKSRPSIKFRKGTTRSFNKFTTHIQDSQVPIPLANFLTENWKAWASKLIEYRDCALHYEILSPNAWPSVIAVHSDHRVVALNAWLPDNPEARSSKNYKFNTHVEYLSYAHEAYLQLLDLILFILNDTLYEIKNA